MNTWTNYRPAGCLNGWNLDCPILMMSPNCATSSSRHGRRLGTRAVGPERLATRRRACGSWTVVRTALRQASFLPMQLREGGGRTVKSLLIMAACVLLAAPSVYAQALNCRPPVSSGFGSAGTIVFKVDGSLGAEETRAFNAGLGQWTGRTCSSYGLPELVTSAPFCLVNCDRETWRVRRTSRRQCGFTDPLSKTVFLNPDLGCNLAGTAAHEIGQVLNLGDVGTAAAKIAR